MDCREVAEQIIAESGSPCSPEVEGHLTGCPGCSRLQVEQQALWKQMPLIPVWDALAFFIWLVSFGRKTIRWRGVDYLLREGRLVPVASGHAQGAST